MARIFVTGASGQLGSSLIRSLVKDGHTIHAFVLPNTWHPYLDGLKRTKIFYGDVCDIRSIKDGMKGCSLVYHVAGIVSYYKMDHGKMHKVHVDGTRNVLQASKDLGVKKVVVTGSTAAIGIPRGKKPLNEQSRFDPQYRKVGYMITKRKKTQIAKEFAANGLNVSIVHPTTIYGQGDITMHIGHLIQKIKKGVNKAPPGGNAVIAMDDIITAHKLVMQKGGKGEEYIFADEFLPYTKMYNIIAEIVGARKVRRKQSRFWFPLLWHWLHIKENYLLKRGKKPKKAAYSLNSAYKFRYFDSTKARKELGWKPKTSFREAIKKSIKFYKDQGLM